MVALAKGCRKLQRLYLQENKLVSHILLVIFSLSSPFFAPEVLVIFTLSSVLVSSHWKLTKTVNTVFSQMSVMAKFCRSIVATVSFCCKLYASCMCACFYVFLLLLRMWVRWCYKRHPEENPGSVWVCVLCSAWEPYWPLDVTVSQFLLLVDTATKMCTSESTHPRCLLSTRESSTVMVLFSLLIYLCMEQIDCLLSLRCKKPGLT